ncbi:hypothetical protein [Streptomyces sporangiiformans]|uniref:Uncharacterized protein n=1 Tax=Streptomyces sporangiiformans TaxID=2315329 RepID=A0A505CY32_9ACTN|nr:hypothetical protein [Streptomyces sporangiiformans]TPQ16933.1 hypothetical protein FGD71_039165 [Streptomyces sporangiiformans]
MTRNVETYSALREIPTDFLTGFCLACAERGSGVFAALATPTEAERFFHILDTAWKAPLGEVDEDELVDILEDFEARTGSVDFGDPGSRTFSVVQSAMLAVNAIAVCMHPNPTRAEMSGQTLETILGSFDFEIGGRKARVVRPGEETATGRLQRLEQNAQASFVESVRSLTRDQDVSRLDRSFLEALRDSCAPVRDEIKNAAASVAELNGWVPPNSG